MLKREPLALPDLQHMSNHVIDYRILIASNHSIAAFCPSKHTLRPSFRSSSCRSVPNPNASPSFSILRFENGFTMLLHTLPYTVMQRCKGFPTTSAYTFHRIKQKPRSQACGRSRLPSSLANYRANISRYKMHMNDNVIEYAAYGPLKGMCQLCSLWSPKVHNLWRSLTLYLPEKLHRLCQPVVLKLETRAIKFSWHEKISAVNQVARQTHISYARQTA